MTDPMGNILADLRRLVAEGAFEAAAEQLRGSATRDVVDADLHFGLARISEEVGDLDRAVFEYNLAIRDGAEFGDAHRYLARLRCDRGELARAERVFRSLVAVGEARPSDYTELAKILEQMGKVEDAHRVLTDAAGTLGDPSLAEAASKLERVLAVPGGVRAGAADPGAVVLAPADADAINLATRFSGREGVYARQWAAPGNRGGYSPIREPFTQSVARRHLAGDITVGIYPVRLDQTVNFMAFDLDLAAVQAQARSIVSCLASLGMPAYIEDSGFKGRHVWSLFASPLPAVASRRIAQWVLDEIGELPPDEVASTALPRTNFLGTHLWSDGAVPASASHRRPLHLPSRSEPDLTRAAISREVLDRQ